MKAYGVRKADDNCCPGHSKYGNPSQPAGSQRRAKRSKSKEKARKAKMRKFKIEL